MKNTPFANRSASEQKEALDNESKRIEDLRASLTRLVKNEDFRMWFRNIVWISREEYGVEHEMSAYDQGGHAMIATLKESLVLAEGGPDFLADITKKHFAAFAEKKIKAMRTKETEN